MTLTTERVEITTAVVPTSTNIAWIGYHAPSQNLYVVFHSSDDIYQYGGVPEHVYNEFINADSVGHYYSTVIKGRFARGITTDDYEVEVVYPEPVAEAAGAAKPAGGRTLTVNVSLSNSDIDFVRDAAELFQYLVDGGWEFSVDLFR